MRNFFIVIGIASVGYGAYWLLQKKKASQPKARACPANSSELPATGKSAAGTIDPSTIVTTSGGPQASVAPVNNSANPVVRFDTSYQAKFPPITRVEIAGAGSTDNLNTANMHQIVQF